MERKRSNYIKFQKLKVEETGEIHRECFLPKANWPFDERNGRAEKCLDKYSRSPSLKTFGSIIGTLSFLTVGPLKRSKMGNRRGCLIYVSYLWTDNGANAVFQEGWVYGACVAHLWPRFVENWPRKDWTDISSVWMPKWKLSPSFQRRPLFLPRIFLHLPHLFHDPA